MSVDMTTQSIAVADNWVKVGNDYVGSSPNGATSGGTAALGWSANDGVADGNTITITTDGTYSFGTKTNAKPMYFWDAKDGLSSSSLSRRAFTLSVGSMNGGSDLTGSSDSYKVIIPSGGGITTGGPFYTDLDSAGDHIAMFAKRKADFTGSDAYALATDWNIKGWRWWYQVGDNNVVLAYGQTSNDHGNPRFTAERTIGSGTGWLASSTVDINNYGFTAGWKTELLRIKQSTIDVEDGLVQLYSNGNAYEYNLLSTTTAYPNAYREFYWYQAQKVPSSPDYAFYYDCVYLDDTPHMVLISDTSTWQGSETGTEALEIAIPLTWSSTTITAQLRAGELSSFSGKYIYVLGDNGEPVTTTGVLIP